MGAMIDYAVNRLLKAGKQYAERFLRYAETRVGWAHEDTAEAAARRVAEHKAAIARSKHGQAEVWWGSASIPARSGRLVGLGFNQELRYASWSGLSLGVQRELAELETEQPAPGDG